MKVKTRGNLIELMSAAAGTVPEWVNLLPAGELSTSDGLRYLVDQAAMEAIMASVNARRVDLVIDYEHQTYEGGQAPAAGWVKELQARPDGIWGRVAWTERGKGYVANREYRYLSPVILVSKDSRRVMDLVAVGLTNVPRINDFPPLTNKDKGDQGMNWLDKLKTVLGLEAGASEEQAVAAVEKTLNSAKGLLATLRTLVGLNESAEAPQVLESVKTELNKAKAGAGQVIPNSVLAALKLSAGAGESAVLGAIRGLQEGSQQLEALQNRLEALERGDLERQANSLVDAAMKAGKVAPASKDDALKWATKDPKGFEAYMNTAPRVVPMGDLPDGPTKTPGAGLDDVQREVNKMLGVPDEVFSKHFPASKEV